MSSQELVTINGTPAPPAAYSAYHEGRDETGLSEVARLKPSNILLVQPATRECGSARVGQLYDTLTTEVYDSITVVPLKVTSQRVYFPPGEIDLDAEPICRSNDGVVPSPFAQAPQSLTCSTCEHSKWVDGRKSACAQKLKMLVATKDTGLPRFFTAGGKSITALRGVLQRINEAITVNEANIRAGKKNADGSELRPLALFDFFLTISSEVVNGKFKYAVARFDNLKRVANPGDFGALFTQFVLQRKLQEQEERAAFNEAETNKAVSGVVEAQFVSEV